MALVTPFFNNRRVFLLIVAIGVFAMAARPVTDPDVWWHLKTGQLILQNRAVFHSDPYSFTKFGQPWINHEWLSDVIIFNIYRSVGWIGLIGAFAAVVSATAMIVFCRCGGSAYLAAAFTVWGTIASAPSWGVRPQAFSLLLSSVLLLLLERSQATPELHWWILPLMAVWVNLHAGFAIGIAFIALFLLGESLDRIIGFTEPSSKRLKYLSITLASSIAIVPLNPYGIRMYAYPFLTIHSHAMQAYIAEWASPNFHQPMYLPALFLLLAIFVAASISPLRLPPSEWILLSATTWAGLQAARHIPLFVLVAVPILAQLMHAWLLKHNLSLSGRAAFPRTLRTTTNGVVLAALMIFSTLKLRSAGRDQESIERKCYPTSAVAFLFANHVPGPMLNAYNWGGYLIWKLYPQNPVFIDGRADVYGDDFLDQFAFAYELANPSWVSTLERYHVETVVLPPESPLASALRQLKDWKQLYGDTQAVIFHKARLR
jgi:hypothetical protein